MPGEHRDNPVTRETVYRVYHLPEDLRSALRERRQVMGQTVREFVAYAIETELPGLVQLLREQLPVPGGEVRPARLPLTERLLEALKQAGDETGLPASRLLLACLARAARRKRRRRGTSPPTDGSGRAHQEARGKRGRRRGSAGPTGAPILAREPASADSSPATGTTEETARPGGMTLSSPDTRAESVPGPHGSG
jgi:hypothetical protein